MSDTIPWPLLLSVAATTAVVYHHIRRASNLPRPPGPPGLPLIGNLLDIPKEYSWVTYREWSRQYDSDIIRLKMLGTDLIILNSYEAATDLLDKRGAIYSDRPVLTMLGELSDFNGTTTFLSYGPALRRSRRAFQRELGLRPVRKYRPMIERGTHRFLQNILSAPEDLLIHYRLMAGTHILGIAYGLDIRDGQDPHIVDAKIVVDAFSAGSIPGAFLVDTFPFLKYIPECVPGAHFQRQAREWRQRMSNMRDKPFERVKAHMEQGDAPDCAVKALLNTIKSNADSAFTEDDVKNAAATMYAAGADTTVSALGFFSLAMVLDPTIQAKAQKMIDEICPGRLPTFEDRPHLPYIDGILKETLRWSPVLPLNVPRRTEEDDIYKGFFIPKGSIVTMNSWAILHDEEVYPDPYRFNPDRWLKDGKLNSAIRDPDVAFGNGRRTCPGRFMVYEAMWLTIASFLAVFEITKAKDERGKPITPEEDLLCGTLCSVKPFKYEMRPRSEEHERLVRALAPGDGS